MSRLDGRGDWEELAHACRYRADLLAKKRRVSVRQLERFVQEKYHKPLHVWLNEFRQKRAAVLVCGDKEMKEIAFELYYNDPSQFSRAFKKFHGMTPTAYRAGHRRT